MLVTGASKGIGRAIALTMAQSGARGLALLARSSLSAVKEECLAVQRPGYPLEVQTLQIDISNHAQVEATAKEVEKKFGQLDIVINNAGYLNDFQLIAESDPLEWWKVWEVNLHGMYNITRTFLPLLIVSGGDKTIINLSSIGAHVLNKGQSSYAVGRPYYSVDHDLMMSYRLQSWHFSASRSLSAWNMEKRA